MIIAADLVKTGKISIAGSIYRKMVGDKGNIVFCIWIP
ncbi:hypothetical protein C943_04569 [Mariniradius saccharolyticus AK6]|uniref:Uncharacterized protein n=1 Tax=Mariniradius saccharolyticus AK6 TaxID=1239962 RepID=M7X8G2_9BACT|nr:hypothetical protein C943_04569 [Mariniradius saccharolyticus AK6]